MSFTKVLPDSGTNIEEHYTLGNRLGQPGATGYAVRATQKKTGKQFIAKVLRRSTNSRYVKQLRNEVAIMQACSHPNIVRFEAVFEDEKYVYIVMELCEGGELFDRIKARGRYSEEDAAAIVRDMCRGLSYLHKHDIAHCDLKPDNFLFKTKAPDSKLVIIDFGFSKFVGAKRYHKALVGTPYYIAPEVLKGHYTKHADMWSLGVVVYVMLCGYPPFFSNSSGKSGDAAIFRKINKGFKPVVRNGYGAFFPKALPMSAAARDLIAKLLTHDTAARLTADECLEHPWVSGKDAPKEPLNEQVLTNLQQFTARSKFHVFVLNTMSNTLTENELAGVVKTFKAIDKDGNGEITLDELREALSKNTNKDKEAIIDAFKRADLDGNGSISYSELLLVATHRKLMAKEERLRRAFTRLDADGNGYLTPDELASISTELDGALTAEEAREMIETADHNSDGKISFEEFMDLWRDNRLGPEEDDKADADKDDNDDTDGKSDD